MKTHRWDDLMREKYSGEEIETKRAKARSELLEVDLKQLREFAGKTQVELAELTSSSQAAISQAEKASDHRLSTLRRIVQALGGELEVVAVFGERHLRLKDV